MLNRTPVTSRGATPVFERASHASFRLCGVVGDRLNVSEQEWLLTLPGANPGILQNLFDRDRTPRRDLMPWAGEFPGKYLTSAARTYRLTRSAELRATVDQFVEGLEAAQAVDGYLGPFPHTERLVGKGLWDVWGHYHCLLGLMLWAEETGSQKALNVCTGAADYLCSFFLDGKRRVVDAGSEEMNESIIHGMLLLYERTGNQRYLTLAREVEKDWEVSPSGDYVRQALAGKRFFETPKPRWESLHCLQGIVELYFLTGQARYRAAFESLWWSIAEFDRHNTGGFSSGEAACGNPYDPRAIETCCTVAWSAITVDMLRMTGDVRAADELELSFWNGVMGAMNASGRWWTYNTPMNGVRRASADEIVFQARAGSPELNCCSVNGPRGLGELSEWAVMLTNDGIVLNYYGAGSMVVNIPSGNQVTLRQQTEYPVGNTVMLEVSADKAERFVLELRIPGWSTVTRVRMDDREWGTPPAGEYLSIEQEWRRGHRVELAFDFSPRYWAGEKECARLASLYRGPLLLAYDPRFGPFDPSQLPPLQAAGLHFGQAAQPTILCGSQPLLLVRATDTNSQSLTLCDFASAGAAGNEYVSWLPISGLHPAPFSRRNPMRIATPAPSPGSTDNGTADNGRGSRAGTTAAITP